MPLDMLADPVLVVGKDVLCYFAERVPQLEHEGRVGLGLQLQG